MRCVNKIVDTCRPANYLLYMADAMMTDGDDLLSFADLDGSTWTRSAEAQAAKDALEAGKAKAAADAYDAAIANGESESAAHAAAKKAAAVFAREHG